MIFFTGTDSNPTNDPVAPLPAPDAGQTHQVQAGEIEPIEVEVMVIDGDDDSNDTVLYDVQANDSVIPEEIADSVVGKKFFFQIFQNF